jgi:renalase
MGMVRTPQLNPTPQSDVLVVGAGLAGLAAARDLANLGYSVQLVDKSRGVSGRAATRRLELPSGEAGSHAASIVHVDHGAQYFTVRSERLRALVPGLVRAGVIKEWTRGFPLLSSRGFVPRPAGHPRYACPQGMASLGRAFLEGEAQPANIGEAKLSLEANQTITGIWPSRYGFSAVSETGRTFHGRTLVLNMPAPQALALVRPHFQATTVAALENVVYAPCWAAIIPLDTYPDVPWVGVEIEDSLLSWAALDHTRRAAGAAPVLVLHASGPWSRAHLEDRPEAVLAWMLQAARGLLGEWVLHNHHAIAHRWRYAQPVIQHPEPYISEGPLVLCGDWCAQGRVEGAIESGWAAAGYLKRALGLARQSGEVSLAAN